jgi:hypothetical protein
LKKKNLTKAAPKASENAPVEAVGPAPTGGESVGGDSEVAQSE